MLFGSCLRIVHLPGVLTTRYIVLLQDQSPSDDTPGPTAKRRHIIETTRLLVHPGLLEGVEPHDVAKGPFIHQDLAPLECQVLFPWVGAEIQWNGFATEPDRVP